ncbi:hypothetical protein CCP4SC76_3370001 [Gammaproteobacteria bacterium]
MKSNMIPPLASLMNALLTLSLGLGVGSALGAASISVTVAVPKGSAGDAHKKIFSSKNGAIYTPCLGNTGKFDFGTDPTPVYTVKEGTPRRDAFTITVSISNELITKDNLYKWTPYLFVVNPMGGPNAIAASPLNAYQLFAAKKYSLWGSGSTGVQFLPVSTPADISSTNHAFMDPTNFVASSVKEDITGGGIFLDDQAAGSNLPQGLYYVVAIIADQAAVNFADPATWQSWDVAPFILGTPWATTGGTGGNTTGDCQ